MTHHHHFERMQNTQLNYLVVRLERMFLYSTSYTESSIKEQVDRSQYSTIYTVDTRTSELETWLIRVWSVKHSVLALRPKNRPQAKEDVVLAQPS